MRHFNFRQFPVKMEKLLYAVDCLAHLFFGFIEAVDNTLFPFAHGLFALFPLFFELIHEAPDIVCNCLYFLWDVFPVDAKAYAGKE